ncbi:hypothetical protein ABIA96_000514 [Bradyrhizobium sp. LB11.1]|jgi:hypothetical protein
MHVHLFRMQRLAPFGAHHHRVEQLPASLVLVQQRTTALDNPDLLIPPSAVAESHWQLYQQPESDWTSEMEIRPFGEKW